MQSHDHTHAQQGDRQVAAEVHHAFAHGPGAFERAFEQTGEACQPLEHQSEQDAFRNPPCSTAVSPGSCARAQDRGTGHALGKRQIGRCTGHEHAPHGDHQHHAEQPAGQGDEGGQQRIEALPGADQDQRRHGKDDACGQRFACRSRGLRLVGFQQPAGTVQEAQQQHGQHRGRNGSRHGHADLEAEIDVGRAHDDGQRQADGDGGDGEFTRHGGLRFFRPLSLTLSHEGRGDGKRGETNKVIQGSFRHFPHTRELTRSRLLFLRERVGERRVGR